jgi:hypothetical protein
MSNWKIIIKGITTLQDRYTEGEGEMEFEQMRDKVVAIFRAKLARYLYAPYLDDDLNEILDELAEVDTASYYNAVYFDLYDWCDDNRVWIDPIE